MKTLTKINIAFMCSILLICSTSYAMEIELVRLKPTTDYNSFQTTTPLCNSSKTKQLKNLHNYDDFEINTIDDIPKLPLEKICERFQSLSTTKQNQLLLTKNKKNEPLAELLVFKIAVDLLPEIQRHILRLLMDGDELSAQLFYKTPFWYAQKKYCEAKEELEKIPTKTYTEEFTKVFNKLFTKDLSTNKSVAFFFRLSMAEKQEIIKFRTPSKTPIDEGNIIIDIDQQHKIHSYDRDIQKTFFADQDIIIMTDSERNNAKHNCMIIYFGGAGIGIVCGIITGLATGSVIGYLAPPFIGALTTGAIGHFYCNRKARDEAQRLKV